MLTIAGCKARQRRLLGAMEQNHWDLFLTCNYRTVYYLTGALGPADVPTIFLLSSDGRGVLLTSVSGEAAADKIIALETYSIQRCITQPVQDAARLLRDHLAGISGWRPTMAGVDRSSTPAAVIDSLEGVFAGIGSSDATETILALRKRKEPDEIEEIRASLRLCAVAYRAAREAIAPGKTELDVYNAMFSAVVQEAGTTVAFTGDFACGARAIRGGGPPTRRRIEPGDLYILDLFPAPALYFGDTCRTFAVSPPTDLQHKAWEIVVEALHIGERMIRPGVRARGVYQAVKDFLDSHEITEKSFWHHAGHGIGHHGHEAPRIIPGTEDMFEIGDVITLEPGVYTEALRGGIRLEDNYAVHEDGLENLFSFPMEL
jgi:Xaa-Pro aminopeptidase